MIPPMLRATLTISGATLVESIRQPIYLLIVLLAGVLIVFTTWSTGYSLGYSSSAEISGDNKLLLDIGAATILVAGMLLASFVASAVLSREIESHTVLTVVSKPIERASVVLGKYLGVAAAITLAVLVLTAALLMAIRHGVMTTAADELDQPVITFALLAVALSLGIAGWCNFYYGWSFPQTATLLLVPTMIAACVLTLLLNKKWSWQPVATDLKPQVITACAGVGLALLVLSALATAVSTRLGQVMTIAVCAGVFLLGLLSNHLLGRHAYRNQSVAFVSEARPVLDSRAPFDREGDQFSVTLAAPPRAEIRPGEAISYGPNPNGFRLAGRGVAPDGTPPHIVVVSLADNTLVIERADAADVADRPPAPGDHVFLTPTRVNRPAAAAHALVPNLQHYWLIDAVTQNNRVPGTHLGLLLAYSSFQIVAFLSLGVVLFQTRDVG